MGDRLKNRKKKTGLHFEPSWFQIMLAKKSEYILDQTKKVPIPFQYIKSSVSTNHQVQLEIDENLL